MSVTPTESLSVNGVSKNAFAIVAFSLIAEPVTPLAWYVVDYMPCSMTPKLHMATLKVALS